MMVQAKVAGVLSKDNSDSNMMTNVATTPRKQYTLKASDRCKTLLSFIREKKWDEFLQRLEYHEEDAREWIEEDNDDGTPRWKSLLIHLVCERRPPANVVGQLILMNPDSLGEKNYGGDLPIHVACREGANKDVIDIILNSDEYESAKVADCEGRLPLHLAAGNKNASVKTIQSLIKVYERATRTPDDFDLLPLHWACSKNASPRAVETIIQAYPYAVEVRDSYGRTPLDLAKKSRNPEKAHILELLSRDVSSWTSALMSTVVTLSNKIFETERMESDFKVHMQVIEEYKGLTEEKEKEVETLKLEMQLLEERFTEEIDYLKKMHQQQLERQKEESDEVIAEITKLKEEAEKNVADLKLVVDEVVSQLKQHQIILDEKESDRKKLKEKAMELLRKVDDQKSETRAARDENLRLKQEKSILRDEVERKEEDLRSLKSSLKQPMKMRGGVESRDSLSDRASYHRGYEERREDRTRQYECTKLNDGYSSFE